MKTFKNILKTLLAAIMVVAVGIALCIGLAFLLGWVITVLSVSWIVVAIVLFIAIVALVFWATIGAVTVEEGEKRKIIN